MPVHKGFRTIVIADEEDRVDLRQLLELFSHASDHELTLTGPEGESHRLAESLQYLLQRVVETLAQDQAVAFQTIPASVPVDLAARILNVPAEYVRTLLSDEELFAVESAGRCLIPLRELLAYKQRRDADRHAALAELTRLSEEFGLYDWQDLSRDVT